MAHDPIGPGLDRPLGFTESLCARWYEVIPCGLQVVAAVVCARTVTRAHLVRAVDRICAHHPAAASRVVDDGTGCLRFAPAVPGAVAVAEAPPGTRWRDRYAAQLSSPLDPTQALWRVELVADPVDADVPTVVLVTGCHTILDGISATSVLRELLGANDVTSDGPLPAMEDLLPVEAPAAAPGASPEADRWPVARRAPSQERTFGFTDRTIDRDLVVALQQRAHVERTTIGALLAVACSRARHVVPAATDHVGFNVPYDVRPRTTPKLPATAVGAYFGRAHVFASGARCDAEPWDAARDLSEQLQHELATMVRPTSWDDETIRALLRDICRDDRSSFDLGVLLTDLGACDLGPDVTACFVTTVQTTGVEAFVVSAVSPEERDLCLGIGWPRPLVDDDTAHRYADELVRQLARLAAP